MTTRSTRTSLYGVFGKPVSHSMGPILHNILLEEMGIDAVYLAFEIGDIQKGVDAIRTLGLKGVSITIPYKESIIPCLDEIDDMALRIGAVNTVINRDGHLFGCNTDCDGAIEPLKAVSPITHKQVLIFGAGGAARAVAFGVAREGGGITIVNRNEPKGRALAGEINGRFIPWDVFHDSPSSFIEADIIINCTSLGMTPQVDNTPVRKELFSMETTQPKTVMDIVYNPLETRLLQDARENGCTIVDGLAMFVHQGAAQFQLFTGVYPSLKLMRDTIEYYLKVKG